MQDKHGILTAPIPGLLKQLTVPMIFGIVAILMFNLIDTFFISLLGTEALAAVSFTFPVTFAVNCITMGIGVGLSTCIARLLGQGYAKSAAQFTTHGLLLAVLLVVLASTIGFFSIEPLFLALGATSDLIPLIDQYMSIWYLTVPLLVIPMSGNSAIRATGDTKSPAKIMMLAGFINGVLDPLLIFGYGPFPELGVQGAAIASGISWGGALVGSLWVLIKREKMLSLPRLSSLFTDWWQILRIGTPAAFANALNPLSGAILMIMLASQGTAAVAAYGAAQRVESLMLIVVMAITSALSPIIAQNMGAEHRGRVIEAISVTVKFSLFLQFMLFIMMVPLSIPISHLFSQEPSVRDALWNYLLIVPLSYCFQAIVMILISSLNALHMPIKAFQWSFMRLFVFLLPCAWLGRYFYASEGLFAGIAVGNTLCGVAAFVYLLRFRNPNLLRD
ncbi:MATE family efflux transporter [Aliivibrio kagoshimensis]|uniref:MATE family efflux transporter n=1 Tax=Aliivibrio kagoshimensis TaxID=2910230 RepID=UPI003D0C61BB